MDEVKHTQGPRLTVNQMRALRWFAAQPDGWVSYREYRKEMVTETPRSLHRHGLLDHSVIGVTHYRITDAGRAALSKASGQSTGEVQQ